MLALSGAALALVATGVIVWRASQTLVGQYTTFRQVLSAGAEAAEKGGLPPEVASPLIRAIELDKEYLYGRTGAASLGHLYQASRSIGTTPRQSPPDQDDIRAALDRVADYADHWETRRRFGSLIKTIYVASVFVAAGVVLFAVAVTMETRETASIEEPTPFTLYLSAEGSAWFARRAGCNGMSELQVTAVGGTFEQPVVVVAPTATCRALQFEVRPEIGVASPGS